MFEELPLASILASARSPADYAPTRASMGPPVDQSTVAPALCRTIQASLRPQNIHEPADLTCLFRRHDEAFDAAMECIQTDVVNGERFYKAELYRVSAECCFRRAEHEDAKGRFRRALEIAQNRQAR